MVGSPAMAVQLRMPRCWHPQQRRSIRPAACILPTPVTPAQGIEWNHHDSCGRRGFPSRQWESVPGLSAQPYRPLGVAVDDAGSVFFADAGICYKVSNGIAGSVSGTVYFARLPAARPTACSNRRICILRSAWFNVPQVGRYPAAGAFLRRKQEADNQPTEPLHS